MSYIKVLGKLPHEVGIGFSLGVDSVAISHFIKQDPRRKVHLHFVHHGTDHSEKCFKLLKEQNSEVCVHNITGVKPKGLSLEEWWRNERYKIFHSLPYPLITCHHLDDCVETYLFNAINGRIKTIPYSNGNVIRPFLLTEKNSLVSYAKKHGLFWVDDESNLDVSYARNRIRHQIVPEVKLINPGINSVVSKLIKNLLGYSSVG